jgi:hypothetical protein
MYQVCGLILEEARTLKLITKQKPLNSLSEQEFRDLVREALLSLYSKVDCTDTIAITDKSYTRVADVIGGLDQSRKRSATTQKK